MLLEMNSNKLVVIAATLVVQLCGVEPLCPPGTVTSPLDHSTCYKLFQANETFVDAEAACQKEGGNLASITNGFANAFITDLANKAFPGSEYFFIGLNSFSGTWAWTDGSNFSYQNWALGQPAENPAFQCVESDKRTGIWFAAPCFSPGLPFACTVPESPGNTCPPSPTQAPQTCPKRYDCEDGWILSKATRMCYKVGYNQKFWDANATCSSWTAALASVHSAAENKFIRELTMTGQPKSGWINQVYVGMFYDGYHWKWADGSDVDYTNWASGEPDHDGGKLTCVEIYSDQETEYGGDVRAQWNDWPCDEGAMRAFVCKKPALYV